MIRLKSVLTVVFLLCAGAACPPAHAQQTSGFPDIQGVWTGTYSVAFPRSHPVYPDQSANVEMELDIYRQEGHLFWALNRWRPQGQEDWFVEEATGAFDLSDATAFYISERPPFPVEWATTGIIRGTISGDRLNIVYQGGIAFSVILERTAQ